MQAAGRIAQNILLHQTPLQTIGIKLLKLIFETNNHIFSIHIFSYLIVNIVTIVSTLLLKKRNTAFEYHNSVNLLLVSKKLLGHKFVNKTKLTWFTHQYQ